jgi:hypothetical protein
MNSYSILAASSSRRLASISGLYASKSKILAASARRLASSLSLLASSASIRAYLFFASQIYCIILYRYIVFSSLIVIAAPSLK